MLSVCAFSTGPLRPRIILSGDARQHDQRVIVELRNQR